MLVLLTILVLTDQALSRPANNLTEDPLIQNDWASLRKEVTIRLFSPDDYIQGVTDESDIWDMGKDIDCIVHDDLTTDVFPPANFNSDLPTKVFTHGFSSQVTDGKTNFVNAWMQQNNKEVNVILVNWSGLAFAIQAPDWDSVLYDAAARNAIDIGQYLGHCLAGIHKYSNIKLHLAGHSLGAHLMGKAGRIYHEITGEKVDRITGCDPAGPRFVDGPIMSAIPELYANRLNPESGSYVDVIHTDGSLTPAAVWIIPRAGDLHQLGHVDFYPHGGSEQNGCDFFGPDGLPGGICSHRRSTYYFLHSIFEPNLFPSRECSDVDSCSNYETVSEDVVSYMGQASQEYWTPGERKLYFLDIQDNHWDYYAHNTQF